MDLLEMPYVEESTPDGNREPRQQLAVINRREDTIWVSLAGIEASIDPEGEHTFAIPLGQLLE
jgi:hypothetical protein